MTMTPEQAIERLDELPKKLNRELHSLSLECDEIREQWEGLKRVGGARADHAATLLSRLRPALANLSRQGRAIEQQINGWVADPFGRNEQVGPAISSARFASFGPYEPEA